MKYDISMKGSDDMTHYDEMDSFLKKNGGMLRSTVVREAGIPKPMLYEYIKRNDLQQVARGVYVSDDVWPDSLYLLHLRCGQAIFSHETALFFHDLTDREPSPYSITVKTGYNPHHLKADGIKVYTVKKSLHEMGLVTLKTPFGNEV